MNSSSESFFFIYGPPGSGKSTLARAMGRALGLPVIDLDAEIERQAGQGIPEIFAAAGEAGFRQREKAALQQALAGPAAVVALGGGALLDPENRRIVESAGRVLCLSAPLEVLRARLQASPTPRPLLHPASSPPLSPSDGREGRVGKSESVDDRLAALLAQRREHYASFPLQLNSIRGSARQLARQAQVLLGRFHVRGMGGLNAEGYDVVVQPGGLADLGQHLRQRGLHRPVALVADSAVAELYAPAALDSLAAAGYQAGLVTFPTSEAYKTLETVASLWQGFLGLGLERRSTVVALGGGVTGDMAGFAAAAYLRGVAWVAVPTTLLAMADASLGGKTGCDLPQGKNLVGAFYPPRLVLADPQTLATLPERELRSGLAEVVKSGIIDDPELFAFCARGWLAVSARLEEAVRRSMAVKVRVVQADPYERGSRASLNLGHTLGHAVETASNYSLLHGEAIAIGMVAEARLAEKLGLARPGLAAQITACLDGLGLPTRIPAGLSRDAILKAATVDKKRAAGSLLFALPQKIGRVLVGVTAPGWEDQIERERETL